MSLSPHSEPITPIDLVSHVTTSSTHSMHTWNFLLDEALIRIYQFLNEVDRINMSGVCRQWRSVFYSPELWRMLKVAPTKRGLKLAEIVGQHAWYLTLLPSRGYNSNKFLKLLSHLQSSRLRSLTLTDLWLVFEWKPAVIGCFLQFLRSQQSLEVVDMTDTLLHRTVSSDILSALTRSVHTLKVARHISRGSKEANLQVWSCLRRLACLTSLSICFEEISTEQLCIIAAQNEGRQLCNLGLRFHVSSFSARNMDPSFWIKLTDANPQLNIEIWMRTEYSNYLPMVLLPPIPLTRLHVQRFPGSQLNVPDVIRYVTQAFPELEFLEVDCEPREQQEMNTVNEMIEGLNMTLKLNPTATNFQRITLEIS